MTLAKETFDLQAWMLANPRKGHNFPKIVCKDGFTMSVQASEYHYCSPRCTGYERSDGYRQVEVGFPSKPEDLLEPYAETDGDLTESVYPWTPVEVVETVVDKHGGLKE